jgi:hypothetical protein
MLILAGVSLNAILGDNGIITKAQDAKVSQAVASLSEYMQTYVFDKQADDLSYDIEDLYVSSGWLERKIEVDEEGNAYYIYLINKLKIEDGDLLAQINNGSGDPYTLKDVYGVNPDFTVWYKDGSGNLVNSEIQVVAIDNNTEANFSDPALSTAISNAVGVDEENVTIGQLKNVTTLKLNVDGNDSGIKNLDDLYYLPNLRYLYIYNLNLDNINGLKYTSNLYFFYSYYNTIANFDGLQYLSNLRTVSFYGNGNISTINDNNVSEMFSKISILKNITSLTINTMIYLSKIEKLNAGLQNLNSKSNITSLSLVSNFNLDGELNLTGMNNLIYLYCNSCQITKIFGLENMKLRYFEAQSNNLQYIGNLVMDYENCNYTHVYLINNINIEKSSIQDISIYLINASNYTIDPKYIQFIEGNKNLDYGSTDANTVVDGYIEEVSNSVTTVNLSNKTKLTNIDFLNGKINITTLNLSGCTGITQESFNKVLSTLTGLKTLTLTGCYQLTSLDGLSKKTIITNLNLSGCTGITQESFNKVLSTLTGLKTLYLSGCFQLIDISFIMNMPLLQTLFIDSTSVEITNSNSENAIALNNASITYLKIGYNGTDTQKYKCNNTNLMYIQTAISNCSDGNGLYLEGNENANQTFISQLENCILITKLTMRYYTLNGINSLDLSKCVNLESLFLDSLNIDSVNINNCKNLTTINISSMKKGTEHFSIPDFSDCLALQSLTWENNLMTSTEFNKICVQLENASNFKNLYVNNNSILDINNINLLSNLIIFGANNNNISDISSISTIMNLGTLYLKNNNLDNDAISIITTLRQTYKKLGYTNVYLGGNPNITDITPLTELGFNATILLAD